MPVLPSASNSLFPDMVCDEMKLSLITYFLLMMILTGAFGMVTGLVLRQPSIILFGSMLSMAATAGFVAGSRRDEKEIPGGKP